VTFAWPSKSQRPTVFGILNVTPDSFSDGGNFFSTEEAIAQAGRMISEGADAIDVGGESTRPGAKPVSAREELKRVLPVIRGIRSRWSDISISIDTVKAEVARAALAEGASIVNDVSGMSLDPEMARVCAEAGCSVVLMHSRGTVADMASYDNAVYGNDPVGEIVAELEESVQTAQRGGIHPGRIALDPGIGFSKRTGHSLAVLVELPRIVALGYPVFVGASRRSWNLSGRNDARSRIDLERRPRHDHRWSQRRRVFCRRANFSRSSCPRKPACPRCRVGSDSRGVRAPRGMIRTAFPGTCLRGRWCGVRATKRASR